MNGGAVSQIPTSRHVLPCRVWTSIHPRPARRSLAGARRPALRKGSTSLRSSVLPS